MKPKLNIISKYIVVAIDKRIMQEMQKLLDKDMPVEDAGSDEVMNTFTVDFGDGIEADIKFCNTDNGPYIDAVLFNQGSEVFVLDPQYIFEGEYSFEFGGVNYTLTIKGE